MRIFLIGLMWVWAQWAGATAIREVSLSQALRDSELVFQGRVIDRWVVTEGRSRPFTRIVFQIDEIIKGAYPDSRLVLDFAGAPEAGVVVAEMRYPEKGEMGIYFVESLQRRQANPLYGWSQGHFRIVERGGGLKVVAADGNPVVALERKAVTGETKLSQGVAKGVGTKRQGWDRGLDPEQFKDILKRWMEEQAP